MQIGISMASAHRVRDPRQGANQMIERTRVAAAAGLDSLFVGDHHVTAAPYYQNSVILARMLAEWPSRPAGALYLLPLWNPVLVAEQTATLASLTGGPFILQCALGGDPAQSAGMGIDIRYRPSMFEQSLDIIRRLWAGETLDADGHYPLRGSRIAPLPPEPIEVWIGATAHPAIDRAARLGDGWIGDPGLTPEQAKRRLQMYHEACDRVGHKVGRRVIRRDIYVGESQSAAARAMAPYVERGYRGFDPTALVIGDPASVADQFAALFDLGYTDVLVRNISADQTQALACLERLAEVRQRLGL